MTLREMTKSAPMLVLTAMVAMACGSSPSAVIGERSPAMPPAGGASGSAAGGGALVAARPSRGSGRFVVFISSDRERRDDYVAAVRQAALGLQRFYGAQLGGWTFALPPSVVEVVRSDKAAMWFTENPGSGPKDGWGFQNALAEARRIFGTEGWGEHVWVLYSDGPGNSGRGGGGVAYMPEDDLFGLIGAHPTQPNIARWIAGGGHELGHAFGLPHPPDMTAVPNAIMGAGFYHC